MIDIGLLKQMNQVFIRNECLEKVILFGSRAKGNHKPNSDIDLAILGCSDFLFCELIAIQLNELPTLLRFDVIDYEKIKNLELKEHIDRVGCIIYVKDFIES